MPASFARSSSGSAPRTGRGLRPSHGTGVLEPMAAMAGPGRRDESRAEGRPNGIGRTIWTVLASGASKAGGLVSMLILVPLVMRHLGNERAGVWMTMNSLTVLIGFADLGMGTAPTTRGGPGDGIAAGGPGAARDQQLFLLLRRGVSWRFGLGLRRAESLDALGPDSADDGGSDPGGTGRRDDALGGGDAGGAAVFAGGTGSIRAAGGFCQLHLWQGGATLLAGSGWP